MIKLMVGIIAIKLLAGMSTIQAFELHPAQECRARSGLPNFFAKCTQGGTVKVAYLGGSITQQRGWRVQSLELLRKLYPQTKFSEIDAAIGGTGSNLGVFRLTHDVLQYKPDLLIVEFATNDSFRGDAMADSVRKNMEGIVRNTWGALPDCDICFVYTVAGDFSQKLLEQGKCNPSATVHEQVAEHYGIPSIHMGVEAARLALEGKLQWKADKTLVQQVAGKELDQVSGVTVNPDGKIPFARDGVHPYLDTGHKLYATAFERSLPELVKGSGVARPHTPLPVAISDDYVRMVEFIDTSKAGRSGNWSKVENPTEVYKAGDFSKFIPSLWKAEPGARLHFHFRGRSLMLYTIAGPDLGICRITVNNKEMKYANFDQYSGGWRLRPVFPASGLDPEVVHTAIIEILPDQLNKEAILAKMGSEGQIQKEPQRFVGSNFLLGGICIEDGIITSTSEDLMLASSAPDKFRPKLVEMQINEKVCYTANTGWADDVTIDVSRPVLLSVKMENTGEIPATMPYSFYIHLLANGKTKYGDYSPALSTDQWMPGTGSTDQKQFDLSEFKGGNLYIFIGCYSKELSIDLANDGASDQGLAFGPIKLQ